MWGGGGINFAKMSSFPSQYMNLNNSHGGYYFHILMKCRLREQIFPDANIST